MYDVNPQNKKWKDCIQLDIVDQKEYYYETVSAYGVPLKHIWSNVSDSNQLVKKNFQNPNIKKFHTFIHSFIHSNTNNNINDVFNILFT